MRRLLLVVGLSLALVTSLVSVVAAADGLSYGERIKACTGLSYGQLKLAAVRGELADHDPTVIEGLRPAWGAKRTWLHIRDACVGEADVAGFGEGKSYGKRILECTSLTYGQLRLAALRGELPGHDPALIDGLKPAWGAKRTWLHIVALCPVDA